MVEESQPAAVGHSGMRIALLWHPERGRDGEERKGGEREVRRGGGGGGGGGREREKEREEGGGRVEYMFISFINNRCTALLSRSTDLVYTCI